MKHDTATAETSETPAPFRRPMRVASLSRRSETQFRVAAEPRELEALAAYLDVLRVDRLTLAGFISPEENEGWRVRGRLVARVDQACVVSLATLHFRHEAEVDRHYLPADRLFEGPEIRVLHDEDDTPDPYEDSIDPALLAVETLALMIDPYPRAAGAEFRQTPSPTPSDPEEASPNPFAALAALKPGRDRDSD